MSNTLSRRRLLRNALYAGGATLSAPLIANIHLPASTGGRDLVEEAVQSLFSSRSPFEAHAQDWAFLAPWQMRGANHALGNILGLWGVRPDFNEQPDYSEAAKCRSNFKMFESTARNNGFGSFSGVDRSPYDNDAGILIAKDDRDRITAGQQYGPDAPEVAIEGVDPDLLNAGVQVLSANRLVGGRVDLVRATTLIKKDRRNVQTEQQEDPVPFSALDTAYGSQLVYVPPQFTPRGTPDNYSHGHGFVGIVLPRASRWYWRGLA